MTVRGTLNADALSVAQITIDVLKTPAKVQALAALVNTKSGTTLAWCRGDGGVWSQETREKIVELQQSMERDLAQRVFTEEGASTPALAGTGAPSVDGGLTAHLGEGDTHDAPSV